jgi:hypothetical protein
MISDWESPSRGRPKYLDYGFAAKSFFSNRMAFNAPEPVARSGTTLAEACLVNSAPVGNTRNRFEAPNRAEVRVQAGLTFRFE